MLIFLDTGSNYAYFCKNKIPNILGIDLNTLKRTSKSVYGANNKIKKITYKYNNFACFTRFNNDLIFFNANKTRLGDMSVSN